MIIQCDFDGTITRNNLSVLLRENFASAEWQKLENDYLHGSLAVEQSNKLQYRLVKESKEKLQEFVRQHIEVKPGFLEFVDYCRESAIPFVIVSSGLDFYIETVLAEIGMPDLELHCGQTYFGNDGIIVSYHDPEGNIINEGFKKKYLTALKKRGNNIIYIGDGLSDLEAARDADHVFATGHVPELLTVESVLYSVFSDFYDLLHQVRLLWRFSAITTSCAYTSFTTQLYDGLLKEIKVRQEAKQSDVMKTPTSRSTIRLRSYGYSRNDYWLKET